MVRNTLALFSQLVKKKDTFTQLLQKNEQLVNRIITNEHTYTLYKNVLFSQDSDWSHLELTDEHIRIEYNEINEEYQRNVDLYFDTTENIMKKGIPLCFKPVKVENNTAVGGGATVYLDRLEFANFLREKMGLSELKKIE